VWLVYGEYSTQCICRDGYLTEDIEWLTGHQYSDLIHLYGLARAGYVPQTFSVLFSYPGQEVVRDLLAMCKGRAIIHDVKFAVDLFDVPSFVTPDILGIRQPVSTPLCEVVDVEETDMAMVFHTSGTTGGEYFGTCSRPILQ
jgi:hypothetical protein